MRSERIGPLSLKVDAEDIVWTLVREGSDSIVVAVILDLVDHGLDEWGSVRQIRDALAEMLKENGEDL